MHDHPHRVSLEGMEVLMPSELPFSTESQRELAARRGGASVQVRDSLRNLMTAASCRRARLWRPVSGIPTSSFVVYYCVKTASDGTTIQEDMDANRLKTLLQLTNLGRELIGGSTESAESPVNRMVHFIAQPSPGFAHLYWCIFDREKTYRFGCLEALLVHKEPDSTNVPLGIVCLDKDEQELDSEAATEAHNDAVDQQLISLREHLYEYNKLTHMLRSVQSISLFTELDHVFQTAGRETDPQTRTLVVRDEVIFETVLHRIQDWLFGLQSMSLDQLDAPAVRPAVHNFMFRVRKGNQLEVYQGRGRYYDFVTRFRGGYPERLQISSEFEDADSVSGYAFSQFEKNEAEDLVYPDVKDEKQYYMFRRYFQADFVDRRSDLEADEAQELKEYLHEQEGGSIGIFPVRGGEGHSIGLINVMTMRTSFFNETNRRILRTLAGWIGVAYSAMLRQESSLRDNKDDLIYHHSSVFKRYHQTQLENLLAVAVIDMDDFKPINDRYGHQKGDRVLRRIKLRLLRDSCAEYARSKGVASPVVETEEERIEHWKELLMQQRHDSRWVLLPMHYGGDEFLILFGQAFGEQLSISSVKLHDRVIAWLENSMRQAQDDLLREQPSTFSPGVFSMSSGVAFSGMVENATSGFDALLKTADANMYVAKSIPGTSIYSEGVTHDRFKFELDGSRSRIWRTSFIAGPYRPKLDESVIGRSAFLDWSEQAQYLMRPGSTEDAVTKLEKSLPAISFKIIAIDKEGNPIVVEESYEDGAHQGYVAARKDRLQLMLPRSRGADSEFSGTVAARDPAAGTPRRP